MSLKEVVLEIAETMEKEAKEWETTPSCERGGVFSLKMYASQLRIAVKASGDAPASTSRAGDTFQGDVEAFHREMVEKAKRDNDVAKMIFAIGGPHDGTVLPISSRVKVGEWVGEYQLRSDGNLHYEKRI